MDEGRLLACAPYVELNPVRARRRRAWRRCWIVQAMGGVPGRGLCEAEHRAIRAGKRTGRPLGSAEFVSELERRLGRGLARPKAGPEAKAES